MGLQWRQEIDAAIAEVQKGKLTSNKIDYLNLYGDLHLNKLEVHDIPVEQLLYRS